MKVLELKPVDNRKSFYGKATVLEDNDAVYLKRYNTIVAKIVNGELIKTWDGYSATTARHLHSFCIMYGIRSVDKKTWCSMPVYTA